MAFAATCWATGTLARGPPGTIKTVTVRDNQLQVHYADGRTETPPDGIYEGPSGLCLRLKEGLLAGVSGLPESDAAQRVPRGEPRPGTTAVGSGRPAPIRGADRAPCEALLGTPEPIGAYKFTLVAGQVAVVDGHGTAVVLPDGAYTTVDRGDEQGATIWIREGRLVALDTGDPDASREPGERTIRDAVLGERHGSTGLARVPSQEEAVDTGWLGIQIQELTPALRSIHSIPDSITGLRIAVVEPDSPLFDQGVRANDVVVEVNQQPVDDVGEFLLLLEGGGVGSLVRFYISRMGHANDEIASFSAVVRVP
jgi:hypothetical protein